MSESPRRHHVIQAPVRALDADGRLAVGLGTCGFAGASLALGLQAPALAADGRLWWWWVCLTATALGVVGWVGLTLRTQRHARRG